MVKNRHQRRPAVLIKAINVGQKFNWRERQPDTLTLTFSVRLQYEFAEQCARTMIDNQFIDQWPQCADIMGEFLI